MDMTAPTRQDYDMRKNFLDDLKILDKTEYEEIFRIIKRNNISFSENTNGIFFDLNQVPNDVFEKMHNYMNLCKTQRKNEDSRIQELSTLRHENESASVSSK